MTFIFYDTETTGLEPAFDQILQFAAIVTDDEFNVVEQLNLRCRLQPHVLPSPGAMFVTGVGPGTIQNAPLSCYEMVRQVRSFIERWSPAILTGFNSISYDEKMLRQAFYQHLHPVYLTNTRGNSRMDILVLAHAVAAWKPEVINVPVNEKGRPTFKLGLLMEANGLKMGSAHDAHADTQATLDLARYLKSRAPDVWNDVFGCRSRALVTELLERQDVVCFTDRAFGKPTIVAGLICASPDNAADHAMFDLEYDPGPFLDIDVERAKKVLRSSPRPIRILRANSLPVVRPWQAGLGVDFATATTRLERIRLHPSFASVIRQALAGRYDDSEPSDHIEEHIYGGFPGKADAARMGKFHSVPWAERYGICQAFDEEKYRTFGERLIHAEYPAALPPEVRARLDSWCRERHQTPEECGWTTRANALQELENLRESAGSEHAALLAEIEAYFST